MVILDIPDILDQVELLVTLGIVAILVRLVPQVIPVTAATQVQVEHLVTLAILVFLVTLVIRVSVGTLVIVE